jgi:hypothetical protein
MPATATVGVLAPVRGRLDILDVQYLSLNDGPAAHGGRRQRLGRSESVIRCQARSCDTAQRVTLDQPDNRGFSITQPSSALQDGA